MLTLAEELGLGGMSLAGRVRRAFYSLSPDELAALCLRIREECQNRHMVYVRDGQVETIRMLPCPVTMLPDQVGYVNYVSQTIHNALRRFPDLYLQDFAVREILQLPAEEERWLWDCWGKSQQEFNPIFGRLDAVVDFTSPMWKETLRFVEPNMSGIGGLHLVPTCEAILSELVLPVLVNHDERLKLEIGQDIRQLLIHEVLDHLEAIGRPPRNVCFVEPRFLASGIDEQEDVARYYQDRFGMRVMHADPAELTIAAGEVCFNGVPIDLVYRDYAVADLIELERQGRDVEPMRLLFRQNRVVSSIAAELDQKSCWEVLTDPQLAPKYFSPEERQIFRRHILWTRIVSDRRATLPDGQPGDLLEFARRDRETLVLKPNRSCGGDGVLIGPATTQADWEQAIDRALADSRRWVVQQLANIPVNEFPVIDDQGAVHLEPFYLVMGFAPSRYGLAVLARASQKQVVNVAQRGGMCAVAIGRPPSPLVGPERLG